MTFENPEREKRKPSFFVCGRSRALAWSPFCFSLKVTHTPNTLRLLPDPHSISVYLRFSYLFTVQQHQQTHVSLRCSSTNKFSCLFTVQQHQQIQLFVYSAAVLANSVVRLRCSRAHSLTIDPQGRRSKHRITTKNLIELLVIRVIAAILITSSRRFLQRIENRK